MRAAIATLLLCLPTILSAEEVGDTVIVTAKPASLKSGADVVGTADRGELLSISRIKDGWYWVESHGVRGWINSRDVIPLERGLDYFTAAIRRAPSAGDLVCRGLIRQRRGEFDQAFADFDEAIRLDPGRADAFSHRALMWEVREEPERALADYDEAIHLDPEFAEALGNRAALLTAQGDFKGAAADLREAVRLEPSKPARHNALAWLLATCADPEQRDGELAVRHATQACELTQWRDANSLDTLAAACAETGAFEDAIRWELKAIELAAEADRAVYDARLTRYESREPLRVPRAPGE